MLLLHSTDGKKEEKTEHLKQQQDYDPVLDWKATQGVLERDLKFLNPGGRKSS